MTEPTKLPDKCQYCGLRVQYAFRSAAETHDSDKAFAELRQLHQAGIVKPRYSRAIGMSNVPGDFGTTDVCAVASAAWLRPDKACGHWVLRIEGASVADYQSIHHDRKNHGVAVWAAVAAAVLAVLIAAVQAVI